MKISDFDYDLVVRQVYSHSEAPDAFWLFCFMIRDGKCISSEIIPDISGSFRTSDSHLSALLLFNAKHHNFLRSNYGNLIPNHKYELVIFSSSTDKEPALRERMNLLPILENL